MTMFPLNASPQLVPRARTCAVGAQGGRFPITPLAPRVSELARERYPQVAPG
jgi:hypothetical protein